MEEDDNSVIQMLQYGVKGYLLKNISSEELLNALEQMVKYGVLLYAHCNGNIPKHIEKRIINGNIPKWATGKKNCRIISALI